MQEKKDRFEHILSLNLACILLFWISGKLFFLVSGFIIGLTPFLLPAISQKISKGWKHFGELLGKINGAVLLAIVFFLILTPIALIYRLGNRHKAFLINRKAQSTFVVRNHEYKPEDLKNMW